MALAEFKAAATALMDRMRWANMAGLSFSGHRDLYQILGYRRTLTFFDFYDRYMRDGIAKAVVEAYPTATWRGGVELYEDENPKNDTKFELAFKLLDERIGFWQKCQQVDIAAGLSTFAVMLIGNGESDVEAEMKQGGEVLFLKPYFGGGGPAGNRMSRAGAFDATASVAKYDTDPASERFGEPKSYWIRQPNANMPGFNREVHWSRIIHVAEGTLEDDVFGIPTLQCVFNLFDDLAKLTGGGSEAFWLRANQGLLLNVDKDMGMPGATQTGLSPEERTALREKAEELQHQLQRVMVTRGVTATQLGSDVAQFSTSGDFLLKLIAGAARVPLRILVGSDRVGADLDQDAANFDSRVQDRRTGYAGPKIVRRAIDRFIEYDMLPRPKQYTVGWPVEENMDEDGKAKYALTLAQVNQTQGSVVFPDDEIRDMAFDKPPLTAAQKKAIADEKAAKVEEAQAAMGAPAAPEEQELKAALRALEQAIESGDEEAVVELLALGDLPGHEFHGNQWTKDVTRMSEDDFILNVVQPVRDNAGDTIPHSIQGDDRESLKHYLTVMALGGHADSEGYDYRAVEKRYAESLGFKSWGAVMEDAERWAQEMPQYQHITHYTKSTSPRQRKKTVKALAEHNYATTQVQLPAEIAESLFALGRRIDDADLYMPEGGRETDAHVTLKYGIVEPELSKLRAVLDFRGPMTLTFGRTDIFEASDYDVVYVEVDSPGLVLLNRAITNLVECAPSDHGEYVPHATVAYVRKGAGSKYVGLSDMEGMTATVNSVTVSDAESNRTEVALG